MIRVKIRAVLRVVIRVVIRAVIRVNMIRVAAEYHPSHLELGGVAAEDAREIYCTRRRRP